MAAGGSEGEGDGLEIMGLVAPELWLAVGRYCTAGAAYGFAANEAETWVLAMGPVFKIAARRSASDKKDGVHSVIRGRKRRRGKVFRKGRCAGVCR